MNPDGAVLLLNYRADGITPYFTAFKDGLKARKVVSGINMIKEASQPKIERYVQLILTEGPHAPYSMFSVVKKTLCVYGQWLPYKTE